MDVEFIGVAIIPHVIEAPLPRFEEGQKPQTLQLYSNFIITCKIQNFKC